MQLYIDPDLGYTPRPEYDRHGNKKPHGRKSSLFWGPDQWKDRFTKMKRAVTSPSKRGAGSGGGEEKFDGDYHYDMTDRATHPSHGDLGETADL